VDLVGFSVFQITFTADLIKVFIQTGSKKELISTAVKGDMKIQGIQCARRRNAVLH
jgi:hypothetical protein